MILLSEKVAWRVIKFHEVDKRLQAVWSDNAVLTKPFLQMEQR